MSLTLWIILALAITLFFFGIRIIRPTEKALIETLGKYSRTQSQGFTWIIPIIQTSRTVNVTERMVDVKQQKIITKDDLNADVDAVVYFRVTDPVKAVYEVDNFAEQIVNLAQTTLRNIIGKLTLTEANSKRGLINKDLEKELQRQIGEWGMKIVRVEMQRIDPPKDVQQAMNDVVVAERKKNAAKDLANAAEIEADGIKRAEIKQAEGDKQAQVLRAEGSKKAFELINQSFKGGSKDLKQLEVAEEALKKNSKIVLGDSGKGLLKLFDIGKA